MGLVEIIQNHNSLVTDIKELDGNVKSLVYRNYSRFLAATDTIRKIKATALDMDKQVLAVDEKMNQIAQKIQVISDNLTPKRSKIEHLTGINSLVKKLNFIITMPQTLTELIESKKYSDAVLFYVKATALLKRYQDVTMFKQIEVDCDELIKFVTAKVQNRVFSGTGTIFSISEGIGMLVGLEVVPASDLGKQFMYKVSDIIDKLFAAPKHGSLVNTPSFRSEEPATPATPAFLVATPSSDSFPALEEFAKFNRTFLNDLGLFADCYDAYFVKKRQGPSLVPELEGLKQGCFASSFTEKEHEAAGKDLTKFLKEKLDKYFNHLDKQLKLSNNLSHNAFNQCVQILNQLKKDVADATVLRKIASIDVRMAELTVTVLDRIIQGVFGKVNQDFFEQVKALTEPSDSQAFNTIRQMTNWIKETLIAKALPALEEFVQPDNSTTNISIGDILGRIKAALMKFWSDLALEMLDNRRKDTNPYYLILSRLSSEWSKGVIESIFSMYNERLFLKIANQIYIPGLTEKEINACSQDTTLLYRNLSEKLMSRYAQVQVAGNVFKIREYALQPLLVDKVTMVTVLWRNIQSLLDTSFHIVKKVFQNEVKTVKTGGPAQSLPSQRPHQGGVQVNRKMGPSDVLQFDNVMDTLDKLFDERLVYLPQKIDLKVVSVMAAITKSLLKCLIEEIRQNNYTLEQCHQFEVDLQFIKDNFGEWLEPKVLNSLADRAIKSAIVQCSEPWKPLERSIMQKILDK